MTGKKDLPLHAENAGLRVKRNVLSYGRDSRAIFETETHVYS